MKFIIGIDAGTTGVRTFCFDQKGKILSSAYSEFKQIFPKPGWVEHDPEEIWNLTVKLINQAIASGKLNPIDADSIGITNQRETTVLFNNKTGKPVYNAIVWQCRRTADYCNVLKKKDLEQKFKNKTGLVIDAYFSGTKINWLLDNVKNVRKDALQGDINFGTIDTWLLYKLTNGKAHKTDYTNASRTLIFNIQEKKWDAELLKILDIPESMLPVVQSSSSLFGITERVSGLPDGIPIAAMVGDQQGALFGQLCVESGGAKNTYGTGTFLLFNTGDDMVVSKCGLITTLACGATGDPVYALEGSVFIAGAVIQFLRDNLKFFKKSSESEMMATTAEGEDEIVFVPAFSGLGAPHWDMDAKGMIYGMTRDTNINQIVRAALKSIAFQTYDIIKAMESDTGKKMKELKIDGGVTANNFLMQFQSDLLGINLIRPSNIDTTVLGAAFLAGIFTGFYKSVNELKKFQKDSKIFKSVMSPSVRMQELKKWNHAIKMITLK